MALDDSLHVTLAALRKYALNAAEVSAQAQSLLEELQGMDIYGVSESELDFIDDTAALQEVASTLETLRIRALNAVNNMERELTEKQNEHG